MLCNSSCLGEAFPLLTDRQIHTQIFNTTYDLSLLFFLFLLITEHIKGSSLCQVYYLL